ncbi:hypothetical protein D8B34_03240 [Verminephrobacter eiseniae]|nr:hypothetical protein [Verminephrobacter eiseniae]MCW5261050.1 hypothetical protein [Verminephrobacter eiseniae]MCW5295563.1 hypothetical protein [Verminephrobacter eiseniae]MCW8184488.1 hypothetical protein [Verminephrobacter eiseniae]MCW8223448.1 hypothetical protein [Verminephrobacter eiseniae]
MLRATPKPSVAVGWCRATRRPPEGAHTAAEREGTPVSAARPPEGAHTAAEGEGTPVRTVRPASMAIRSRFR